MALAAVCTWVLMASLVNAQGGSGGGGNGGPPPALVRVGQVRRESLQARWEVVGRLREVRRAVVAAEQPGRVVEVPVDEGESVEGQETVLARIDDIWAQIALESAKAQLEQAKAGVAEARAQYEQAQRDRNYLDGLLKTGSAKPKEVEDSHTTQQAKQAALDRAEADLLVAQAALSRSQEQLARLTVLAPFDGVVVRKLTEVGQWMNQGDNVAEVISRGEIDVVMDVPESVINHVTVGGEVEVLIEPLGLEQTGRVAAVNPLGSTAARTFPVKVRLDDLGGRLKPGMSVLAWVPTSDRVEVLTVPRDAVSRSALGKVVWAMNHGVAVSVPVEVLFSAGDRYAVSPIGDGDGLLHEQVPVVIEGAERLFPGRPLEVAPGGHTNEASSVENYPG